MLYKISGKVFFGFVLSLKLMGQACMQSHINSNNNINNINNKMYNNYITIYNAEDPSQYSNGTTSPNGTFTSDTNTF